MAKTNTVQTNFTSGEVSPAMRGRVDNAKYFNGVKTLKNFTVKPQGGAYRRHGTKYVAEVYDSSKVSVLRTFVFSNDEAYVIEFANLRLRIYKNGTLLTTIDGTATADGTNNFITTVYPEATLRQLNFTQSADVLYIAHPDYKPYTLSRYSDARWVLAAFAYEDGPYLDPNEDEGITLTVSAVSDTVDVTSSSFLVGAAKTITGITKANPAVVTSNAHGFANGDQVYITGVVGMTQVNGLFFGVSGVAANTFNLTSTDSTGYTAYSSAGTAQETYAPGDYFEVPVDDEWYLMKIPTAGNLTTTSLRASFQKPQLVGIPKTTDIQWATGSSKLDANQSGAFNRSDNGKYARWNKHSSTDNNAALYEAGTIDAFPFTNETGGWGVISYVDLSAASGGGSGHTATVVTSSIDPFRIPSGTPIFRFDNRSKTATVTASEATFVSTDLDRWIRIRFGSDVYACKITDYTSTTVVSVEALTEMVFDPNGGGQFYNNGSSADWSLGAWSTTTGWPSCVTFMEQRLVFARTDTQPQTIWMSETGDFPSFKPTEYDGTVLDTNAIAYTIYSQKINEITWLRSGSVLLIGTKSSEWQTKASTVSEPLSPTNIQVSQQGEFGSPAFVYPQRIGTATLHLEITGRKLREMVYSFEVDAYTSRDLTVISEHILRDHDGPVETAFQQGDQNTVWIVATDGSLLGLTYEKEQEVIAWHRHLIGGVGAGPSSQGFVESIATLPPTPLTPGQLYMVVRRTINGSTKRYIERLMPDFDPDGGDLTTTGMFYLDSHATYSGASTTAPTGWSHLVGATVGVVADGYYVGTKVISGGGGFTVALSTAATVVQAGFNYTSDIELLPVESSAIGPSKGRVSRLTDFVINLANSLNFTHGRDSSHLLTQTLDATTAPALSTGCLRVNPNADYSRDSTYLIRQASPYPLNVLSVSVTSEVNQL